MSHLLAEGLVHQAEGRLDQAARCYLAHLAGVPEEPNGLHLLAGLLAELGEVAEAERRFRAVLAVQPRRPDTLALLGLLLLDDNRPVAALVALTRALALAPGLAVAAAGRDRALQALGRGGEVAGIAPPALREPAPPQVRAAALRVLGHGEAALAAAEAAVAGDPGDAEAWALHGVTLQGLNRPAEALASYDRALARAPGHADAAINRAAALSEMGCLAEALAGFSALPAGQGYPHWAAATLRLQLGDWPAGWRGYEARQSLMPTLGTAPHPAPRWQGEPLAGKRILVQAEQGLGDMIQFCRYAPALARLGAQVVVQAPAALTRLFGSLDGVAEVVARDRPVEADLSVWMLSLPHLLGTTLASVPGAVPYLAADPRAVAGWRVRLAGLPGLKVGLVWAGGHRPAEIDSARMDRRRSLPLAALAPLAAVPGISFVSLQVGPAASQAAAPPAGMALFDPTADLADFADTAALLSALDVVISVDTSVAHLAGALGRPVWLLNRFDRCWRWLWDRDDSPWYPTMRLFNQSAPGDWDGVLARVSAALAEVAHG